MKKNQKFSTASRKFVRFCFARAKRACARDCRRRSFLPNGYDILHRYPIKSEKSLFFNFFQRKKIGVGKSDFVRFCFARAKRACAMRRATSGAAFKMVCSRPAVISRRYPGILQERSEGSVRLYSTRAANAARSAGASEIAAAGRFLLMGMIFFTKNERIYWNNAILELYYIIDNIFRSF